MVPNTGTIFKRERSNLQSMDPDDEDHSEEEDVFDAASNPRPRPRYRRSCLESKLRVDDDEYRED